jgi:hypothetical protein
MHPLIICHRDPDGQKWRCRPGSSGVTSSVRKSGLGGAIAIFCPGWRPTGAQVGLGHRWQVLESNARAADVLKKEASPSGTGQPAP